MRGVDCTTPDGQPVFVRVYAHDDSTAQVLQNWKGSFGAHRALDRGSDWFVIGPEETIAPVSSAESVAASSVRVPDAEPLTGRAEARTTSRLEQAPDTQFAARLGDLAGPFIRFCRDVPPESGAGSGQASPAA